MTTVRKDRGKYESVGEDWRSYDPMEAADSLIRHVSEWIEHKQLGVRGAPLHDETGALLVGAMQFAVMVMGYHDQNLALSEGTSPVGKATHPKPWEGKSGVPPAAERVP